MTLKTNPKFDPRIYNVKGLVGSKKGSGLTRGRIVQANNQPNGNRYALNFLYNPTAVQAQHSVDTNIVPSTDPNDVSTPIVPLQQSVGFSLLFDRTYELWDRKYNGHRAGELGVYDDVLAIYHVVGITAPRDMAAEGGEVGKAKKGHMATMVVSPMVYTPVWVYFGGPLKYYGVISSLGVTYSHWTQNMIPSRCGIDVSMSLLPKPAVTQNQNLDDARQFNNRIGISPNKTPSMADINRADYGGRSGR